MPPFEKVVVANRGAVAARIIRALATLGVKSVAVYSDADADAPYLDRADEAVPIGDPAPQAGYLNPEVLGEVVRSTGADGLHPGYGFLSEHPGFARRVADTGATWIGPSPYWLETMGHKVGARRFAVDHGIAVGVGSDVLGPDPAAVAQQAAHIGYPLLVKPAGGGGGIGMVAVADEAALVAAVEKASAMAARGFGNGEVYLERLLAAPRHVEFQVLADRHGSAMHLFERDCSTQRRHQKMIEEAPAPGVDRHTLTRFADDAVAALGRAGYDNIGTVETLLAADSSIAFLEMNTRLQVEHGVTEEVTGVDLVTAQIRLAAGETLASVVPAPVTLSGHSVQARVYAEDPVRFLPSPGTLTDFRPPAGLRVETGYRTGMEVTRFYDPLLAKVIATAPTRHQAIDRLAAGLAEFAVAGVKTNIPALLAILESEEFREGRVHTGLTETVMERQKRRETG